MNAQRLLTSIDNAILAKQTDGHRKHLGASLIGRSCARQLWYVFRWAHREQFSARMLRLFERGHLEELRFITYLRDAGAKVYNRDPNTGKQWVIEDADGHFGGSCDTVAVDVPQLPPGMPCVVEMKTHNKKSFDKLKDGVEKAKPEHYTQLQVYMLKLGIDVGLYLAVNKDDDDIYAEFMHLDSVVGYRALERARNIIKSNEAPVRIGNSPGWFECRFCAFLDICHLRKKPEVNCRTCCHSTPVAGGQWTCARNRPEVLDQRGCPEHLFNPYMLNILRVEAGDTEANWLELVRLDGSKVTTGPDYVTSQDLTL